jgi:hypothetical protein
MIGSSKSCRRLLRRIYNDGCFRDREETYVPGISLNSSRENGPRNSQKSDTQFSLATYNNKHGPLLKYTK